MDNIIRIHHCKGLGGLKELHSTNPIRNFQQVFIWSCQSNYLDVSKWIYYLSLNTKNSVVIHDWRIFLQCCANGCTDVVKWLYSTSLSDTNVKINISAEDDVAFLSSCLNNHLETSEWLYATSLLDGNTPINIHLFDEEIFIMACARGHLKVIRWLYSLSLSQGQTKINIHIDNEIAFRESCQYGYLFVAKWLWLLGLSSPNNRINIRAVDDDAFRLACDNGRTDVVEWLETLEPNYSHAVRKNKIIPKIRSSYLKAKTQFDITPDRLGKYFKSVERVKEIDPCIICFENVKYLVKLSCGHVVCMGCFFKLDKCVYRCINNLKLLDTYTLVITDASAIT
jgi:hypothetical protein